MLSQSKFGMCSNYQAKGYVYLCVQIEFSRSSCIQRVYYNVASNLTTNNNICNENPSLLVGPQRVTDVIQSIAKSKILFVPYLLFHAGRFLAFNKPVFFLSFLLVSVLTISFTAYLKNK
jgi:hypothetical protein